jgi:hypothetical protein
MFVSKVDRRQTRLHRSHATADDGGYMPGTAEERVSQVWELTRAYALAVHGFPRATKDIDFFVWATPENAASLMQALARFGGRADANRTWPTSKSSSRS